MILLIQIRLIALSRCRVSVINFRTINLLECFHGADGPNQFQICIISQQISGIVKGERRRAVLRHDIADLQACLAKVWFSQGCTVRRGLDAQYRVRVARTMVGILAGDAQADHRRLLKVFPVFGRVGEVLENIAVQFTKVLRNTKGGTILIVIEQQYAEIIVAHVG